MVLSLKPYKLFNHTNFDCFNLIITRSVHLEMISHSHILNYYSFQGTPVTLLSISGRNIEILVKNGGHYGKAKPMSAMLCCRPLHIGSPVAKKSDTPVTFIIIKNLRA